MEDVKTLRRDKLTAIISHAHARLQDILVQEGVDPSIARMVAATRVYALLPENVQQAVATAEAEIAARMAVLFGEVMAADETELKGIPDRLPR